MRRDRAGHPGAVRVRRVAAADRVELLDDGPGEIRMADVDLGIDHGNQHIAAGRELVRLVEPQFADHVLSKVAGARLRRQARVLRRGVLLEAVHVLRLREADILGLERAHDVGHLAAVVVAQMQQRPAGEFRRLRGDRA